MSGHNYTDDRGINNTNNLGVLKELELDSQGLTPCVRYGSALESKPTQFPTLQPVSAPVPPEATTASPIYYLTNEEIKRQDDLENPYAVSGNYPVGKDLQDQCETAGRVRYPVVVESDSDVFLDEMALELIGFVEDYLGASSEQYTVWYSGGRSIHVHVAAFVEKSHWDRIKQIAKTFNETEDSDVELDTAIYSRKRQFRLPGVKHQKIGGLKVPIDLGYSHAQIFQRAQIGNLDTPDTFLNVLNETVPSQIRPPLSANQLDLGDGDGDGDANTEKDKEASSSPPIYQREKVPPIPARWDKYWRYNAHPVSPYANAGADDLHSVTVIRVIEEPFEQGGEHFAPCEVLGAIGGGGEYRVFGEDNEPVPRPVKLSGHDIKKWDYEQSEYVVILGGQSRRSRIFQVETVEAHLTMNILQAQGRESALQRLKELGYDTGSTGMHGTRLRSSEGSDNPSEAAKLQWQIEQKGLDAVSNEYEAIFRIACRLLQVSGWDRTWKWIRDVYGDEFNPKNTYDRLSKIVESYPEYDDVTVPSPPHNL